MIEQAPLVFGHFGHWYVSMIYAAPAVLLAGALCISTIRQRHRDRSRRRPPAD